MRLYYNPKCTAVEIRFFYRATLCVSAVFAVTWCPSVRLSVCHVGRILSTWQKFVKLLCRLDGPVILVFDTHARFGIFLRGACATVLKSTYSLRQTYVYVRNLARVICNFTRWYANFIRHKYAVPMHKVRNHTPSYASLRRSCDFFMSTQAEYADNFGVEGTRDYATLRGPGVKGVW